MIIQLLDDLEKLNDVHFEQGEAINNRDTYFLCHRLCKDIKEDKRTGYLFLPA